MMTRARKQAENESMGKEVDDINVETSLPNTKATNDWKESKKKFKQYLLSKERQDKILLYQQRDEWTAEIRDYLKEGKLPENEARAKELSSTREKLYINEENDILYRQHQPNPRAAPQVIYEHLVLLNQMVDEILQATHDSLMVGAHREYKKVFFVI